MRRSAVFVGALFVAAAPATAQLKDSDWSDIDCAKSRIAVPSGIGLRCRVAGQFTSHDQGGSGGSFSRFNATADRGKAAFYLLTEAGLGGYVYTGSLVDSIKGLPAAKDAHSHGEMQAQAGANFIRFTARTGESCIGARRLGPSASAGYRWIMIGTSCAPAGAKMTPVQERNFLDSMTVR